MLNKKGFADFNASFPDELTKVAHAGPPPAEINFEDLVTDLNASFVNVEPEALDDRIVDSLRRIVLFLGVDRSTLGRYDATPGQLTATHSWALPGIQPIPSPLAESRFPFMSLRVRVGGSPVICDRVADLPPEAAADAQALSAFGLRSIATGSTARPCRRA